MSDDKSILTVDGVAAIRPTDVYKDMVRLGYPVDWWGKVNKIDNPVGFEPGSAFVLMRRSDVANLQTNQYHNLLWRTSKQSMSAGKYVYWNSWTLFSALDSDSPTLVELRDRRQVLKMSCTDKSYNSRRLILPFSATDTDDAYYYDSTNSGTPYDWQGIVSDLWSTLPAGVAGGAPTLPFTPTIKPLDINTSGWRTWTEALPKVLGQLMCTVSLDIVTGSFSVVQIGQTQSVGRRSSNQELLNRQPFVNEALGRCPEKIRFYFPKRLPWGFGEEMTDGGAGGIVVNNYFTLDKSTGVDGVETGTKLSYVMDQFAEYGSQDGLIKNQSELSTLADQLKTKIVDSFNNNIPEQTLFQGIDPSLKTGSQVARLVYRDYGDSTGVVTEVYGHHQFVPGTDDFGGFDNPEEVAAVIGPMELIVKNVSGQTLPAGAIVRRTTSATSQQNVYYSVDLCDSTLPRRYVVILGKIADGKYGRATWADGHAPVLYDVASGTPTDGDEWGPKPGEYKAFKDYYGFRVLGGTFSISGSLGMMMAQGHEIVEAIGKPSSVPWTKDNTGTLKVFTKDWGNDTTMTIPNVMNRSATISSLSDKVLVSWPVGSPLGAKVNCS